MHFDKLFFPGYMKDGNGTFIEEIYPNFLTTGSTIVDIGGGSQPIVTQKIKDRFELTVIGIDIDEDELNKSPDGIYDRKICADITVINGAEDIADLIICQATLEHVRNNRESIRNISRMMKSNGKIILFIPCRNAVFARLNLLLSQGLKEKILFAIYPEKEEHQGFPAFYDLCTPGMMIEEFERNGVSVEPTCFWTSSYFSFFFPLYVIWRLYTVIARRLLGHNYCETFILVGQK
ncbi:MAG: hypothetical protein COB78_01385 [Hyphomicrobiales bacterium]|nr:MAG: hypothetical protein COB78_01385 [Hyphomicrobiales bacterium]